MESWTKQNPMIRKIGPNEDAWSFLEQAWERHRICEQNLSTHIKWFTHKNPYGCVICDLLNLNEKTLLSFELFLGPREDSSGNSEENQSQSVEASHLDSTRQMTNGAEGTDK